MTTYEYFCSLSKLVNQNTIVYNIKISIEFLLSYKQFKM